MDFCEVLSRSTFRPSVAQSRFSTFFLCHQENMFNQTSNVPRIIPLPQSTNACSLVTPPHEHVLRIIAQNKPKNGYATLKKHSNSSQPTNSFCPTRMRNPPRRCNTQSFALFANLLSVMLPPPQRHSFQNCSTDRLLLGRSVTPPHKSAPQKNSPPTTSFSSL